MINMLKTVKLNGFFRIQGHITVDSHLKVEGHIVQRKRVKEILRFLKVTLLK